MSIKEPLIVYEVQGVPKNFRKDFLEKSTGGTFRLIDRYVPPALWQNEFRSQTDMDISVSKIIFVQLNMVYVPICPAKCVCPKQYLFIDRRFQTNYTI